MSRCFLEAWVEDIEHHGASTRNEHLLGGNEDAGLPVSNMIFSGRIDRAAARFSSVFSEHPYPLSSPLTRFAHSLTAFIRKSPSILSQLRIYPRLHPKRPATPDLTDLSPPPRLLHPQLCTRRLFFLTPTSVPTVHINLLSSALSALYSRIRAFLLDARSPQSRFPSCVCARAGAGATQGKGKGRLGLVRSAADAAGALDLERGEQPEHGSARERRREPERECAGIRGTQGEREHEPQSERERERAFA